MSKKIIIKLKSSGNRGDNFSITDSLGNILASSVTKQQLKEGLIYYVDDNVFFVLIASVGKSCCNYVKKVVLSTIDSQQLADFQYTIINSASLWKHLVDPTIYNNYYGCTYPYIVEHPFSYEFNDEILQSIQDYSKVYTYLPSVNGVFDDSRKIQTDNYYFNKAVVYNDQQSSGLLKLVVKPKNNLKEYNSYPKINTDSKTITFTKSDNFYQFNTFWSAVKDKTIPLFQTTCESLSIDKEINQSNMDYTSRVFKKESLRAKDVKIRMILDDSCTTHIVSQLFLTDSQISYK